MLNKILLKLLLKRASYFELNTTTHKRTKLVDLPAMDLVLNGIKENISFKNFFKLFRFRQIDVLKIKAGPTGPREDKYYLMLAWYPRILHSQKKCLDFLVEERGTCRHMELGGYVFYEKYSQESIIRGLHPYSGSINFNHLIKYVILNDVYFDKIYEDKHVENWWLLPQIEEFCNPGVVQNLN